MEDRDELGDIEIIGLKSYAVQVPSDFSKSAPVDQGDHIALDWMPKIGAITSSERFYKGMRQLPANRLKTDSVLDQMPREPDV